MPSASRRTSSPLALVAVLAVMALATWWQTRTDDTAQSPARRPAAEATRPTPSTPPASVDAEGRAEGGDRYDLDADERRGGHTLARHVGKTDTDLRARLEREPDINAASSYVDRATAERTVARTLVQSAGRVDAWVARTGSRPNLALRYRGARNEILGRTLERGDSQAEPSPNAVVVLRWSRDNDYYVLTSYPEARR
jgi:hypothetical protein